MGLACIVGGDGGASPRRGRRVGGRGEQLECIFARSAWVFAAVFALVFALVFAVFAVVFAAVFVGLRGVEVDNNS